VTDLTKQLQNMREEYEGTPLRKNELNSCPFVQFSAWLLDAQKEKIPDPNACSLCTVDSDSKPMSRAVLLKGIEEKKFIFYTNYNSRKAKHLMENPYATMHFPWFSIERQVVVAGRVSKVAEDKSEEYFNSRPSMSKLGAWASLQSKPLESREALEESFVKAREKWGEQPPKPPHWGGFALDAESIEFWQGGPARLHDWFIYSKNAGKEWSINRFYP